MILITILILINPLLFLSIKWNPENHSESGEQITYSVIDRIKINNNDPVQIGTNSKDSPLRKTFDSKHIMWHMDDLRITTSGDRLELWRSKVENVTKHGGKVALGFIPGRNETIRTPEPMNLTYSEENIEKITILVKDENAYLIGHCWNHTAHNTEWIPWRGKEESWQRHVMNHTVWTFRNNFGYDFPAWYGYGNSADYNTTIALADHGIIQISGTKNRANHYNIYVNSPEWHKTVYVEPSRHKSLESMKEAFVELYESPVPLLSHASHPLYIASAFPDIEDWETRLKMWANYTEWIYKNFEFEDFNYTEAYKYRHDMDSIRILKEGEEQFIIDYSLAYMGREFTWSDQGMWDVYDEDGALLTRLHSEPTATINMDPGVYYIAKVNESSPNSSETSLLTSDASLIIMGVTTLLFISFAIAVYVKRYK